MTMSIVSKQIMLLTYSQSPLLYLAEILDESPRFKPGFQQVCLGFQLAFVQLTAFRVEILDLSRIDLSRHVEIDLSCFQQDGRAFSRIDRWTIETTKLSACFQLFPHCLHIFVTYL